MENQLAKRLRYASQEGKTTVTSGFMPKGANAATGGTTESVVGLADVSISF